ncbi:MAG: hypothetical protein P8P74_13345 [Crocinitomicaceae bacterium]|nr:hypothetical protein [Crocinitomicaceae bacterium]
MIKRLIPLLFVLAACSSEKTPFCKCMEAGDEFSAYSADVLNQPEIDEETETKMNELKAKEKELCKDYETMGGAEMLELREDCTEMNAKDEALQIEEK